MEKRQFNDGGLVNVRELDVGMTIIFPKIVDGKIQLDKDGMTIADSDVWLSKRVDPIDKAWQIHLIGKKAEYIFTHIDSPEAPLKTKDSYLMKTDLSGKKYGCFTDSNGKICVRPKFVSFSTEYGFPVFWILNDNDQHDDFTDQFIMVVKQLESKINDN